MADTIYRFLEFTGKVSNKGEAIPGLDTQVWVGKPTCEGRWYNDDRSPGRTVEEHQRKTTVLYRFYKKPMASKLGILGRSAVPEGTKVSTAVSEVRRRWKNTSWMTSKKTVEDITLEYMDELAGNGYSVQWRRNIIKAALGEFKGYAQDTINRPGASTARARRVRKLVGKATWFSKRKDRKEEEKRENRNTWRKKNKEKEVSAATVVETAVFVPHTPGSLLRSKLSTMEEGLNFRGRVRYVESLGSSVADILVKSDPWGQACGREKCLPCMTAPGKCMLQSVVYCVTCETCREQGRKSEYWGESGRTGHDRGLDHHRAISGEDRENPLVEHWAEHHHEDGIPLEVENFKMKIVKAHRTPLSRQAHEGYTIANFKGDILINRLKL